jgi:hypothetical protein
MNVPPKHPLKHILIQAMDQWDKETVRAVVRAEFRKVTQCRTLALGAEVFVSTGGEELVVPHTCKSRMCPSCGHRANLEWLRRRSADLPDAPYFHVVLTMPDVFWTLLKENRHLMHDLPAIGAEVIKQYVRRRYGAEVAIVVVPHTFGKDLKFNTHLHLIVSQGGLNREGNEWLPDLPLNMLSIMKMWRYAVVTFLRMAHRCQLLSTSLRAGDFARLLDQQYQKAWNVFCKRLRDKAQALRYAGRYVRRPPLAEHKVVDAGPQYVSFRVKDLKRGGEDVVRYPI